MVGKKENMKNLIRYLVAASDFVTAEELAAHLHITTRTVRYYIQQINVASAGASPVLSGLHGYRWNGTNSPSYQLDHFLPQNGHEREMYIIRYLLYRKNVAFSSLVQDMAVSERTVEADLVRIKAFLKKYSLAIYRSHGTFCLRGKETDLRRLTRYCIQQTTKASLLTLEYLCNVFPQYPVKQLFSVLEEVLAYHWLTLTSYTRYELLFSVIIQLLRIDNNDCIEKVELEFAGLENTHDYQAAAELSEILHEKYGFVFNNQEKIYLALQILCAADPIRPEPQSVFEEFGAITDGVNNALNTIGGILGTDFTQNGFNIFLAHYILRLKIRNQLGIFRKCPLARSLRETSPMLTDISASVLAQFCDRFHMQLPEDEVALLTLYLGDYTSGQHVFETPLQCTLVCPVYGTLGQDMARNLNQRFDGIMEISQILDIADTDRIPASDLCISVLPLNNRPHTVLVAPFLRDEDFRRIHGEIHRIRKEKRHWLLTAFMESYIRGGYFEKDISFETKEASICYLCKKLERDRAVTSRFVQVTLNRENKDSTAFYNMVAVPHCCSSSVIKNSVYVLANREPMPWGEARVNIVFLCAIQRELLGDFYAMYDLLVKTLASPKNVHALLEAKDRESFLKILSGLEP